MSSVSQNAALVLVCSLVVLALHFSLHQERAHVGASHERFWSLAGDIQVRTLLEMSTLWQAAIRSSRGPCSGLKGHKIRVKEPMLTKATRSVAQKGGMIEKCCWKSHVAHPVRLTYLDLRLVHVFGLEMC